MCTVYIWFWPTLLISPHPASAVGAPDSPAPTSFYFHLTSFPLTLHLQLGLPTLQHQRPFTFILLPILQHQRPFNFILPHFPSPRICSWGSRLSSTNATSAEAESICQKAHAFASSAGVASISPPPLPLSPSNANHTPSPSSTNVDMAAQDTSEGKKKALNTNGSRPSKLSDEPAAPSTTNSENHQPPHSPSLQSQQEPPSSSCSTTAAAAAAAAVYHAQGEGVVNRGGTQGNEATSAPPAPASRASGGTRGRGRKPVASHNLLPGE